MMRRTMTFVLIPLICAAAVADDALRERLKDANGVRTDLWVYNDIAAGIEEARKQNKPLFVTFRCVPCKDCAAFDADVANGNERVRELAQQKFVSVRQVEMKGVDLSLFQFDHDLNWAGMFINADGVVYARYGTQSAEGSDAYNSIDGLLSTMNRVLELHADYPNNKAELTGKRGSPKPQSSALELPGLRRNREKYANETTRQNCIHCHNIHDAEHRQALETGTYSKEMLWKYPLPDSLGLKIDRKSGVRIESVIEDSAAAGAGIKAGQDIVRMNGQAITSIADMQWVLHALPNTATEVEIETESGKYAVQMKAGWREHDFSWRGSMWNAPPRFEAWAPELSAEARTKLGLPEADAALEVRWINREGAGGQRAFDDGLREKDVIVAIAGQPFRFTTKQFNMHLKLNYKIGDTLPLTVLREGKREELKIRLVE